MYIEGLTPFRIVADRLSRVHELKLSPSTVCRWVNLVGKKCKDTIQVAQELKPKWSGILSIDGKTIRASGKKYTLLLAADLKTQDIVHAIVVIKESYQNMKKFVSQLKDEIDYPLRGVVIDLRPGLVRALGETFPKVPIQACVIHLKRQLDQRLPKLKGKRGSRTNQELRELLCQVLFASSSEEALSAHREILKRSDIFAEKAQKTVIKMVSRHLSLILAHHFHPELSRDNNIIENIIKQLNKKIKLLDGFESIDTADVFIKLLVMKYRFKSFTDSRDKSKNGKSPLELAGATTQNIDWLTYSQS